MVGFILKIFSFDFLVLVGRKIKKNRDFFEKKD